MNGTLGRGIEVGLRQPQAPQQAAMARRQQQQQQDPKFGPILDDVLQGEYEQVDGRTMEIFNDWGEARNYAQSMWKNFGINVLEQDYSNPASVMAGRAFMQKMAKLRNEANAAKRGLEERKVMQQYAKDPNMQYTQRQEGEYSNAEGAYSTGFTSAQQYLGQESLTYEENAAGYKKANQERDALIAQNQKALQEAMASGDPVATKRAEAQLANTEMMRIKQKTPDMNPAAMERKMKSYVRANQIASLMQTGMDFVKNPYQKTSTMDNMFGGLYDNKGEPVYYRSHINPETGKIYALRMVDGQLKPVESKVDGKNLQFQINDIINGVTPEEQISASELAGYGDFWKRVIPTTEKDKDGNTIYQQNLLKTMPAYYYDNVDKLFDEMASGNVQAYWDKAQGAQYLPMTWGVHKDNQDTRYSENYVIEDIIIGKDGKVKIEVRDTENKQGMGIGEGSGFHRFDLTTPSGREKLKELIGYNHRMGTVKGLVKEGDMEFDDVAYEWEPDQTTTRQGSYKPSPFTPSQLK